jgi:2-polyprenyl-3-methyl-5-hydroxy-6-metoxy-1,4-benzoquinol methylase
MDQKTLEAYAKRAQQYSNEWNSQLVPKDIYSLIKKYFVSGTIADIGCGNGRDAAWMKKCGFQVSGFDSSAELVEIAGRLHPSISFGISELPDLREVTSVYDNVFCETVIMHLPKTEIPRSLQSLKRILRAEGILYLSWRVTEGADVRLPDGRLYSAFDPDFILNHFNSKSILHFEDKTSESSGKRVCRLVWKNEV